MRLLEYQSKTLLSQFGLAFTQPVVVQSVDEAVKQASLPLVLKAQLPFGGRGKAGAVRFSNNIDEVRQAATDLFNLTVRNVPVARVSLEPKINFTREIYVGATWDTAERLPVLLLNLAGGVDVELTNSNQLVRRHFNPNHALSPYQCREMAAQLGFSGKLLVGLGSIIAKISEAFLALDAVTLEINPLVETMEGELLGLDAHLEIDDDALPRQSQRLKPLGETVAYNAGRPPTPLELEAACIDAMDHRGVAGRVVEFDGDLALLIGGGGASLTVFDAIRRHGGRPANYCEVGGNPTEEKVAALTRLLLGKPGVRRLAVIMNVVNNTRADVMARGVIAGIQAAGLDPAEVISVFRIPGSWEQECRELLATVGVDALGREVSLDQCARLAVERAVSHVS